MRDEVVDMKLCIMASGSWSSSLDREPRWPFGPPLIDPDRADMLGEGTSSSTMWPWMSRPVITSRASSSSSSSPAASS